MKPFIPLSTILPWSIEAFGPATSSNNPTSGTFSSSNRALFVPFQLFAPAVCPSMICVNGAAVSGNIDMGIYSVDGRRLVSKGSTAQVNINSLQRLTFTTPLVMGAGLYFMALACDNTTATFFRRTTSAQNLRMFGMFQMASAFVLPATATFATILNGYLPCFGLEIS